MTDIKNILNTHGFRFKKSLGQNFITDTNLLRAILADSGADEDSVVVEIGTGAGTLTREIALKVKKVFSFEVDTSLKPVLTDTLFGIDNAEVIFTDILKTDIKDFEKIIGGKYIVIANLPYYITTPIIMYFLEKSQLCNSLTIMVQKEVAQRLCSVAGEENYGSVTVAVDSYGGARITRTVSKTMFNPMPQVDSAVVRIDIDKNSISVKDRKLYNRLYRCAFSMRRKTLANNIFKEFNISKAQAESIITDCGFPPDIRGEKLAAKDFAALSDKLFTLIS